ncbi:MAG TPA: dihydroorotase family protein [Thermoplasmata archaeon]|nr:dihydroorotase family protein [Thermoplasmata archaeon]
MAPARRRRAEAPAETVGTSLILAGRALVHGRLEPVEIAIGDDGRIASVGKVRTGAPRRDLGDAVILPAATDLHVHFRDPGGPLAAESFATGTIAAAIGGVGLIADMPNTLPPVTDRERLEEKAARVPGRAAIDVLLYAAASESAAIESLGRFAGGFKMYLSPTTGIERAPLPAGLPGLFGRVAETGLALSVHAEDPDRFSAGTSAADPVGWNAVRPIAAELAAIDRLASAPPSLRCNVAHITSVTALRRAVGVAAASEVTPHHLLLSDASGTGGRFKVNPPLRAERERGALWTAFAQGEIPFLASDHAPHPAAEKDAPFDRAPSGVPGVETMLPLLLERVRAGALDLGTLVRAAIDRPARWLGQPMGRLAPGHRAHLVVVDFRARRRLAGAHLHSACGWTPFEGWEAVLPREHYRDGERIVEAGEYVGSPTGRVVRPDYARPPSPAASR